MNFTRTHYRTRCSLCGKCKNCVIVSVKREKEERAIRMDVVDRRPGADWTDTPFGECCFGPPPSPWPQNSPSGSIENIIIHFSLSFYSFLYLSLNENDVNRCWWHYSNSYSNKKMAPVSRRRRDTERERSSNKNDDDDFLSLVINWRWTAKMWIR